MMGERNNLNANHRAALPLTVEQLGLRDRIWVWRFEAMPVFQPRAVRSAVVACPALEDASVRKAFYRLCDAMSLRRLFAKQDDIRNIYLNALDAFCRDAHAPVFVGVFGAEWGFIAANVAFDVFDLSETPAARMPLQQSPGLARTFHWRFLQAESRSLVVFPGQDDSILVDALPGLLEQVPDDATIVQRMSQAVEAAQDGRRIMALVYGGDVAPCPTRNGKDDGSRRALQAPTTEPAETLVHAVRELQERVARLIEAAETTAHLRARFDGPFQRLVDQLGRSQEELIEEHSRGPLLVQLGQIYGTIEEALSREVDSGVLVTLREQLRSLLERYGVTAFQQDGEFDPQAHELLNPREIAGIHYQLETVRSGLRRNGRVLLKQRVIARPVGQREVCSS